MRCMASWKQARNSSEHRLSVPDPLAPAKVDGHRLERNWTLRQCRYAPSYCLLRETVRYHDDENREGQRRSQAD